MKRYIKKSWNFASLILNGTIISWNGYSIHKPYKKINPLKVIIPDALIDSAFFHFGGCHANL